MTTKRGCYEDGCQRERVEERCCDEKSRGDVSSMFVFVLMVV